MTGTFIASYTLWDKYAVSTLKVPPLIQGYASLPVMALVLAPFRAAPAKPDHAGLAVITAAR